MSGAVALQAVRRQIRELVDGTLEVKLHVEPRYKAEFHRLFPDVDCHVAIAPLGPIPQEPERESNWKSLGPLAQSAIKLCNEERFQQYAEEQGHEASETGARAMILAWCLVGSRKDLDADPDAATRFRALMADYRSHVELNGLG